MELKKPMNADKYIEKLTNKNPNMIRMKHMGKYFLFFYDEKLSEQILKKLTKKTDKNGKPYYLIEDVKTEDLYPIETEDFYP